MTKQRPAGEHQGDAGDKQTPVSDRKDDNLKQDRTADNTVVEQERRKVAEGFSMDNHQAIPGDSLKTIPKDSDQNIPMGSRKTDSAGVSNSFAIVEGTITVAKAWKKGVIGEQQPEQKDGNKSQFEGDTGDGAKKKSNSEKPENEVIKKVKNESFDTGTIDVKAVNDAQMAFYKQALDGVTDPVLREGLKLQATMMDQMRNTVAENTEEPHSFVARSTEGEQWLGSASTATFNQYAEKTIPANHGEKSNDLWKEPPDGKPLNSNLDKYNRIDGIWNKTGEYHLEYDGFTTVLSKVTIKDGSGTHIYDKRLDGWHIDGSMKPSNVKEINVNEKTGLFDIAYKNGGHKSYFPDGKISELVPPRETTSWPDGRLLFEDNSSKAKFVRIPDKDGGYTETHAGPRTDDSFTITRKKDGHIEVRDKPEGTPYKQIDDPQINAERKKLNDLIDQKITNPEEKARFIANMARFEGREQQMEDTFRKQNQTPSEAKAHANAEIAKTYGEISRILRDKIEPGVPVDAAKRLVIAEQVMRNAATPTIIDQGGFNTCNVAAIEMRTYTRHPAAAAKLVADMATDGKFILTDGKEVKINKEAYQDFNDPQCNPPQDKQRSLASQLFQVTAVNVHYVTEFGNHMHYDQLKPNPNAHPSDSGEVLRDDFRPWFKENHPKIDATKEANIGQQISGDQPKEAMIVWDATKHDTYDTVHDEKSFGEKLAYAKAHGIMPITIQVHCGNEPYLTDSGAGSAGGSGGWHVVNVTDYSAGPPPMVSVDNQWGKAVDRTGKNRMTLDDLYFSMRDPGDKGQIKELEDRRAHNTLNARQEVDLDRHKYKEGTLKADDYEQQIKHHLEDASNKFKNGKMEQTDYNIFVRQFQSNINDFTPTERFKILEFAMDHVDGKNFQKLQTNTMMRIQNDYDEAVKNKTSNPAKLNEYFQLVNLNTDLTKKYQTHKNTNQKKIHPDKAPSNHP